MRKGSRINPNPKSFQSLSIENPSPEEMNNGREKIKVPLNRSWRVRMFKHDDKTNFVNSPKGAFQK